MDHNRQSDLHRTIAPLRGKIDKATRGQADKEMKIFRCAIRSLFSFSLSSTLLVSLSFFLAGCSHTVREAEKKATTEAEKKAAVDEFFAGARSCWPPDVNDGEGAGNPRLAIESVVSDGNATLIRLVAYAPDETAPFYVPIYRMSAGRWSVNEKGRVYLLDEQCREFRLNDSKPSSKSSLIFWGGRQIPEGGRIRLKPGQAFETTLVFSPLPDRTRVGALVYGGRVLPFALD
jgi:hypothetical protein